MLTNPDVNRKSIVWWINNDRTAKNKANSSNNCLLLISFRYCWSQFGNSRWQPPRLDVVHHSGHLCAVWHDWSIHLRKDCWSFWEVTSFASPKCFAWCFIFHAWYFQPESVKCVIHLGKNLAPIIKLSIHFMLLINVKMPTFVGILTFISTIITTYKSFKARTTFVFQHFNLYEQLKFMFSMKTVYVQCFSYP